MADTERSWVELRVHGVSGTPPEQLLDSPHVRQVDGDGRSRFFRPVRGELGSDDADDVLRGRDGHVVEGFHWGRYTSGSLVQSAWITLLPVGLVNLAAFMLPGATGRGSHAARLVSLALLRLLGGLLTLLLALATTLTLADVVAVQWLREKEWAPEWLRAYAVPGAMVLAGLLLAVLGGWSWFARLAGRRTPPVTLDDALPMTPRRRGASLEPERRYNATTPFANGAFYAGDPDTLTLRGLHVALCLCVPALLASASADAARLLLAGLVLVGVVLVVVLVMGDNDTTAPGPEPAGSWTHERLWPWVTKALVGGSLLVLALSAAALFAQQAAPATNKGVYDFRSLRRGASEFDDVTLGLVLAVILTVVLLAVAVSVLARATRAARPAPPDPAAYFAAYSGGRAAIAVAGLGLLLGVGFSAAVVNGAATALTGSTASGRDSLTDPVMLDLVAYAWGLGWVPVIGLVVVVGLRRLAARERLAVLARRAFAAREGVPGGAWTDGLPADRVRVWVSRLANAIWIARLKNSVAGFVWTIVAGGGVLAVGLVLARLDLRMDWPGGLDRAGDLPWFTFFVQLGGWTLLGLVAALVFLVRTGARDGNVRRSVNIIWDVIAFWPHAVHPFIPEPYSLRAVGDLAQRVRDHVAATEPDDGCRRVVVCAHSQGSLLSFAALQVLAPVHDRVALVTFGSQLRVIFPRAFPLYVNHAAVRHLFDTLDGAWVNLYRDTDPLAGPVLSWDHTGTPRWVTGESTPAGEPVETAVTTEFGRDWRLVDPVPRLEGTQLGPVDALRGHGVFWSNPVWSHALRTARCTPVTPDAPPPA